MNKKKIILVGGGGHCKSCIEVIESTNKYEIIGVVDQKNRIGEKILDYTIIGCDADLELLKEKYDYALITVGQIKSSFLREKLFNLVKDIGFIVPVIIASTAYVSKYSKIEEGTIVMHGAIVNANVKIGQNNIINTKALLEHDVCIGNTNHVSTAVALNGNVKIGNNCFIGSNSTLINDIEIGDDIFVGMSSVVYKNLSNKGVYVGNPIRKIK